MQSVPCKSAVKRTEKAMRNKLRVQQGEDGEEEDDYAQPADKDKLWGKNKRGYYGADTQDYEVHVLSPLGQPSLLSA